jgi:tetratricopeptide (TPR) repeat protein
MLSIFPADSDRSGAAAVWELDANSAADALSDLYKLSLVEHQETSGQYRLHDLARVFAVSRLDASAQAEAEQRHAAYYQSVLWRVELFLQGGKSLRMGLDLFDSEWMNIQAGQSWAEANSAISSEIAEICSNFAWSWNILNLRLHPRDYMGWLEAALACARQTRNRKAEGAHLGNLGIAYKDLGDVRKAIEYFDQHLTIAHVIGDRRGEGNDLVGLGVISEALGDARKAIGYYDQSLTIAREIGDRRSEGIALFNMSLSLDELGKRAKAIDLAKLALKIFEQIKSPHAESVRRTLKRWQE